MRRSFVGKAAATGGGGVDRLGALPDEILRHALSFLPSRDAVRTCVLARRWRHLWKSAPALRVTNVDAFRCARHVNNFVNHLIVLRDRTPLRECEIAVYKEDDDDGEGYYDSDGERLEHSQYIDLWVRYALSCNARLLRISDHDPNDLEAGHEACIRNVLLAIPIFSQHLTTLEFDGVVLSCECSYSLDFSSCPNLETLKMNRCSFQFLGRDGPTNLSSQSVRCLSIIGCDFRSFDQARALISVPSVVYLELAVNYGLVPVFESMMPSLLTTSIKLDGTSNKDDKGGSLLLGRLSDSTNLELIAKSQAFAFMKALKRCTTFSKLKTLSLNNWCVEPDFGPLLYFLRRSPNLESLNIRLSKPYQHVEETDGCYNSLEPFLASKHFVVAEIECRTKDERVDKILKVLSSCGVPGEQINVKTINWSSDGSYTDSDYSYSDTEQSD